MKQWYGRSVKNETTLEEIYNLFSSGEFDHGADIGEEYQSTSVSTHVLNFNSVHKLFQDIPCCSSSSNNMCHDVHDDA